jgi:DNA-binding MarR family transcriptional regulator
MESVSPNLTDLILATFRLNGELLAAGDSLLADLGLTSARWQVLGAMDLSSSALPVAHIARNMGLTRQSVQRIVNEMAMQDMVRFMPNPHHQRAKLVVMTAKGRAVFDAAMERQRPWADCLATGLSSQEVSTALRVLQNLRNKLQSQNDLKPAESANVEEFA